VAAQINLKPAREKAGQEFALVEPGAAASNARVLFDREGGYFTVPFLGREYRVYYPSGRAERVADGGQAPLADEIVLLHYLTKCSPRSVEEVKIAFQELPSGSIYIGPFTNRAIRPLVSIFGPHPEALAEAAKKLGGWEVELGDVGVTVPVLPKIPITFVLWEGDEEFPPNGNILFDASAPAHLHTEDYALLPGMVIWEMKRLIGL